MIEEILFYLAGIFSAVFAYKMLKQSMSEGKCGNCAYKEKCSKIRSCE
ncbi:MAG: hypothetical protein ABIH83_05820 [Candidatus Micrarchaeota archaeon]